MPAASARRLAAVKATGDRQARRHPARDQSLRPPRLLPVPHADVARVAGVAAGTVYLYFRSKDDLLVSIFERTMKDAIAEGRAALTDVADPVDRLRRIARLHLDRLGR